MGRDSQAACLDCGKRYYFGYGPRASWMDHYNTIAEFDADAVKYGHDPMAVPSENCRRVRAFLMEHGGHRLAWWSSDYAYVDDAGALRCDYGDDLIEDGIGKMPAFLWFDGRFVPEDEYPGPNKYA